MSFLHSLMCPRTHPSQQDKRNIIGLTDERWTPKGITLRLYCISIDAGASLDMTHVVESYFELAARWALPRGAATGPQPAESALQSQLVGVISYKSCCIKQSCVSGRGKTTVSTRCVSEPRTRLYQLRKPDRPNHWGKKRVANENLLGFIDSRSLCAR